jgi:hypothetical protein
MSFEEEERAFVAVDVSDITEGAERGNIEFGTVATALGVAQKQGRPTRTASDVASGIAYRSDMRPHGIQQAITAQPAFSLP